MKVQKAEALRLKRQAATPPIDFEFLPIARRMRDGEVPSAVHEAEGLLNNPNVSKAPPN